MTYYNEYINKPNENMKYKETLIDFPLPLETLTNYISEYKTSNLIDLTTTKIKEDDDEMVYSSDVIINGIKDIKSDEILKELNYDCIYSDPHLLYPFIEYLYINFFNFFTCNKSLMCNYNDFPQYFNSLVKCYSMMVNIKTSNNMCKYFKSTLNNAQKGYITSKYLYDDVDEKSELNEYFDNMIKIYNDESD